MIKNKLLETFEADSLQYLTLVCIPASSQAKTQARYEEFSERICNELGMINAYPHIKVVSEKEEKHLGGTGINLDNLSFDEDFFKGRYVLLFDDVITKGYSMTTLNIKMKSLGAIVVGGLSLGKTKHERPLLF
jgi:predicted amidophosphoribosyltransferase